MRKVHEEPTIIITRNIRIEPGRTCCNKISLKAIGINYGRETAPKGFGKERPAPGLIVHTDQGSQFTGGNFTTLVRSKGAILSNSSKGNPYDNALMESFYKTLKRELVNDAGFKTKDEARHALVSYIELYYNSIRKHSALGYLAPREYEELNS